MAGFVHILPKIGLKQPSITRYVHLKHVRTNMHSKKCWAVSTQIWVKYGQNQNVIKKMYS